MRDILGYPPLVVRNPGLGGLLCGEARYRRRRTSRHINFHSKGQVLLRNDPEGGTGMGMFFRHAPYMGTCYAKAKCLPGPNAALSGAFVKADRSRQRLSFGFVSSRREGAAAPPVHSGAGCGSAGLFLDGFFETNGARRAGCGRRLRVIPALGGGRPF